MKFNNRSSYSFHNEFKWRNLSFNHCRLVEFYRSQWQSEEISLWFLLYRWMLTLFFVIVFLSSLTLQFSAGKYFIFLTNWGIILCLATQLVAALLATRWYFDLGAVRTTAYDVGQLKKTPKLIKCYWMLHNITMIITLVITSVYWPFIHGKMNFHLYWTRLYPKNKTNRFPFLSFATHCLNSVFMLVDFLIVAFPVRLLHTIYAMMLPIIYFCFSIIYYLCGGTDDYGHHYVYPMLDWTEPLRGLQTFAGIFILYCIYPVLLFGLFRFKRFLHSSFSTAWPSHRVGLI